MYNERNTTSIPGCLSFSREVNAKMSCNGCGDWSNFQLAYTSAAGWILNLVCNILQVTVKIWQLELSKKSVPSHTHFVFCKICHRLGGEIFLCPLSTFLYGIALRTHCSCNNQFISVCIQQTLFLFFFRFLFLWVGDSIRFGCSLFCLFSFLCLAGIGNSWILTRSTRWGGDGDGAWTLRHFGPCIICCCQVFMAGFTIFTLFSSWLREVIIKLSKLISRPNACWNTVLCVLHQYNMKSNKYETIYFHVPCMFSWFIKQMKNDCIYTRWKQKRRLRKVISMVHHPEEVHQCLGQTLLAIGFLYVYYYKRPLLMIW